MSLSSLLDTIFQRAELQAQPPVLIDIGASGKLNPIWRQVAKHSIGVAFDADDRDFSYGETQSKDYKKLYVINRIVVDRTDSAELPFYLTEKPHCSSLLPPDPKGLEPYDFAPYFALKEVVKLKVVELKASLQQVGITQVDWFKTDSQGTDLRLFKSLPQQMQERILIAEFEPGIIDAYVGEDKLMDVMAYMRGLPFYISNILVKGPHFIKGSKFDELFPGNLGKKIARHSLPNTVGWAEILYVNKLDSPQFTLRDFLLAWVFNTILHQHGYALAAATEGKKRFNDPLFDKLESYSTGRIKWGPYSARGIKRMFNFVYDKLFL